MEYDIWYYDLELVFMIWDFVDQNFRLFMLEVFGVIESCFLVLWGDYLFVFLFLEIYQEDFIIYKGFVYKVELDCVKLSFFMSFLSCFVDGLIFKVNFIFNCQLL